LSWCIPRERFACLESMHVVYEWRKRLIKATIVAILRSRNKFADMARHEEETMVKERINSLAWLRKRVEEADTDLLREMIKTMAEMLMSGEADSLCGAEYGKRDPERVNQRNGYRRRRWDTRAGTIDLGIPKLRRGSYFPSWLLAPRRRAERALMQVVTECYVRGVSTRRVEGLVRKLGLEGISKSQVSQLAKELDKGVEEFRNRPLDRGPYTFVWLDAMTQRVREEGQVVNVIVVIAIGVNGDGKREVLGIDLFTSENEAGWETFLQSLVARGLSGVKLVISDAHQGLKNAIASQLPGSGWQRCRTHFMRDLLTKVPKRSQEWVIALVRSIFAQPDAKRVREQHGQVVKALEERYPEVAEMVEEAREEILAFAVFPQAIWRQIWSNNPLERLTREIRRRSNVVGIFPNRGAIIRLVGAVLAEQNDEWLISKRYMGLELLEQARKVGTKVEKAEEESEMVEQMIV
jgi:putative transposase